MMRSLTLAALLVIGSLGNAQASTITFDDIAADGMGSTPGIRVSGGFVFTPATHSHIIGAPGTADAPDAGDASNGTQYLAVDDVLGPDPVTFSPQGGGVFALLGFDIGEWSNNGPGGNFAHQITVLGSLNGGGTLSTTLTVDGVKPAFDTFTFTGWTNLSRVTLKGINGAGPQNSFGLDNVVVEARGAAVPEPATLTLVSLGSAYLIRRRRSRR
jgi:hypothetical protein